MITIVSDKYWVSRSDVSFVTTLKSVYGKECGVATVVSLGQKDVKKTIMAGAASNQSGE